MSSFNVHTIDGEMLFPPPPGLHQNPRPLPPIYSSPCYAKSAPNILRSRGESVPLSGSRSRYDNQSIRLMRGSVGFPGNISGEYGSDDEHRRYDEDNEHQQIRHNRSNSTMQESPGDTHIVTPYAYTRLHPGPSRLDIPYNPPYSTHHSARSRNTSHSTYLSTPTTATTNISAITPTSTTTTPLRSRTTTQTSALLSPVSSSRLQPSPLGTPTLREHDDGATKRQNDNQLMPGFKFSGNRSRGRPGTGSTVDSMPYSVESSVSAHHLAGNQGNGYHSQNQMLPASRGGQGPLSISKRGNQHPCSTHLGSGSIPPGQSNVPRRLRPLYTFLKTPALTVDVGVEGVEEWVAYWVDRGVRVRDLSSDLSGLIKGPLALHPNLQVIQRILQDPKVHLVLPPQLHKCPPLLSSEAFGKISKKIVVDVLVSADRLYSGSRSTGGENVVASELKSEPPRNRFRSNSGSDLRARERKIEAERESREYAAADKSRREGGGSTTPSLSFSASGSGSNGLSRFLSRSSKKDKVSIDHNRPISIMQETGTGNGGLAYPGSPEDPPRTSKRLGFFKRRQKSNTSGKQESTTLDDPVGVGGMSARGLTAIFLGSAKVRVKKDPTRSAISNIERMQIRSLDRTVRAKDTSTNDFDMGMDLLGGHQDLPRREAETSAAFGNVTPQPSSKLREQQVQEVLLAYIASQFSDPKEPRPSAWDLKQEIYNHSNEDNDSGAASASDSRDGLEKGMMKLEALNAKLAQIEFEMILNCGRHFHPAIQSALHKVRFQMGYCSSIQLVKRLNALDREFHRDTNGHEIQTELSEPEKRRVITKILAWIKVRWDIVDRWELAKMVRDEILSKIPADLVPIIHNAMKTALLPDTPFPPFRSSASNFRVERMPQNKSWDRRRPSLPNTLSTWGGSTPKLISGMTGTAKTFDEARIQTILMDILALPTGPNTKELLIEWLRRARRTRLIKSLGWWIPVMGEQSGAMYADGVVRNIEKGCLDYRQPQLNHVFVEVRKAFQLPQQGDDVLAMLGNVQQEMTELDASNHRSSVTPIQAERPMISHHNSYGSAFEAKRVTSSTSGAALQLITEVSPSTSGQQHSQSEENPRPASDETDSENPGRTHLSDESHRSDGTTASDTGYEASQILALQGSAHRSDKTGIDSPRLSLEIPRHVAVRHRKGLSKMSVFSSETALEMASIFATRGSESRASVRRNSSPDPSPEPEPPLPKLSPLTEEPRSISEFSGIEEIEPTLPVTPSKLRSLPLSEEVDLATDGEIEIEDGAISPFPKPTSPPHSIPNRSTSLHQTQTSIQTGSSSGLINGSILKRTVQMDVESNGPALLLPSTLAQVMRLFEPGSTQLATSLTPGMLEIELLKIIESERQKAAVSGRQWSREDVVRVRWLLTEIRMTADVPHINHILARVCSSLESHSAASSAAGSVPLASTGIARAPSSVEETAAIEVRLPNNPLPIGPNDPLLSIWSEFPDEKAALSSGQLRLVNPSTETPRTEEERPISVFARPLLRSAVSSHGRIPGMDVGATMTGDTQAISTRESRRVSFADYDNAAQVIGTISQESFVGPVHEVLHLPSSEEAPALVSSIWSHEIKDAPPPYNHTHRRARSETP